MGKSVSELIKTSDLKSTRQREAILSVFVNSDRLLTAEDVYLKLCSDGLKYGLATVYRTVSALCDHGLLQTVNIPMNNCQYFVFSDCEHTHHLICTKCMRCIAIDECPVEKFSAELASSNGFKMTGHSFQIFGVCSDCDKKSV